MRELFEEADLLVEDEFDELHKHLENDVKWAVSNKYVDMGYSKAEDERQEHFAKHMPDLKALHAKDPARLWSVLQRHGGAQSFPSFQPEQERVAAQKQRQAQLDTQSIGLTAKAFHPDNKNHKDHAWDWMSMVGNKLDKLSPDALSQVDSLIKKHPNFPEGASFFKGTGMQKAFALKKRIGMPTLEEE